MWGERGGAPLNVLATANAPQIGSVCTRVTNDRSIHTGESLWGRDAPRAQVEVVRTGMSSAAFPAPSAEKGPKRLRQPLPFLFLRTETERE